LEPNKTTTTRPVKARTEDSLVLQQLLYAHAPRLLAYIRLQLPDDIRSFIEAEDVLQDVFFEAFRGLAGFHSDGEEAPYRWLVTIARNRVVHLVRSHRALKRGRKAEGSQFGDVVGFLEQLAVYSRTPSASAISHEIANSVQQSLGSLKPDYRKVISFRYLKGLSIRETAKLMGRSETAVTLLSRRSLKALKIHMQSAAILL
jgi:RNA polymerase sigma-70 factor (ECF subfamily)